MSSPHYNPATIDFIRKDAAARRKRRTVASIVGAFVVAGIAFGGYFGWSAYAASAEQAKKDALAAELKKATDFRSARETLSSAIEAGTISERDARDIGRRAWEERQKEVMEGYFATPAKDRDKYLDNIIDEMQKRMAEWQRDRPTTRPGGDRPTTRPDGERRGGTDAEREARGRARADNQSPVERAQQSEFRAALMARMRERGIQMPFGRGGPGGGGGPGGRGPGGGGPGGGGGR
jgi:hypothetical protein